MNKDEKSIVWIIGEWLTSSVSANDLDRLMDCMNGQRLESDRKNEIANELAMAIGSGTFE